VNVSWKHWVAAACLVAASVPAVAQKKDSIVVDGNDWISATAGERRAFLVGAGIGRAAGDTTTGVLIGSGVGMMIDIMD